MTHLHACQRLRRMITVVLPLNRMCLMSTFDLASSHSLRSSLGLGTLALVSDVGGRRVLGHGLDAVC